MIAGDDKGKNFHQVKISGYIVYTNLIIDVDVHPLPEKLSELTDISLAAFITKL